MKKDRVVSKDEGKALADQFGASFLEVSVGKSQPKSLPFTYFRIYDYRQRRTLRLKTLLKCWCGKSWPKIPRQVPRQIWRMPAREESSGEGRRTSLVTRTMYHLHHRQRRKAARNRTRRSHQEVVPLPQRRPMVKRRASATSSDAAAFMQFDTGDSSQRRS
jgi:hypothetical protein